MRAPASAMSTPLSSLRVCPLSDSWDRVPPAGAMIIVEIETENQPLCLFISLLDYLEQRSQTFVPQTGVVQDNIFTDWPLRCGE